MRSSFRTGVVDLCDETTTVSNLDTGIFEQFYRKGGGGLNLQSEVVSPGPCDQYIPTYCLVGFGLL